LKVFPSNGAVSEYDRLYAFTFLKVPVADTAFQVTFFGSKVSLIGDWPVDNHRASAHLPYIEACSSKKPALNGNGFDAIHASCSPDGSNSTAAKTQVHIFAFFR
jgi:hypothetical protein